MVSDTTVVQTAVESAEDVIFSYYRRSEITDMDVTVKFQEHVLEIDIYLSVPDATDTEQVADEAARAAQTAVDQLFEA